MKKLFSLSTALLLFFLSSANHITGGEMYYTLNSQSGNNYSYHVMLKLYRDCNAPPGSAQLDPTAGIAIFSNLNNSMVWSNAAVPRTQIATLNLGSPSPCIQNPPVVCYQVGYYEFDVTLPSTPDGYTIAFQRCCRIAGIVNLIGSSTQGATYTAQIPGTSSLPNAPANNSARFVGRDTVIICRDNFFTYDFGAVDEDGDRLVYSFCNAYRGGGSGGMGNGPTSPAPIPPVAPPYTSLSYAGSFSGSIPLGNQVTLNTSTGLISGIAPAEGIYVVTVCVEEYRNGVKIATQRKDLQIKIGDCNPASAELKPEYITCDGFTFTFSNEAPPSPLINSYYWEINDGFTSTDASPTHTFADTGIYSVKLVVNRNQDCTDSVTSAIKVYPGFFPGFTWTGVCAGKSTQFIDTTRSAYGIVNSWNWNFGDATTLADTSKIQTPTYSYGTTGIRSVTLIVTNNKGCIDTAVHDIEIIDRPPLRAVPKDTLMCNGDSVTLSAIGNGVFSWTPSATAINSNTANPTVFPTATTNYIVQLDDQGCLAYDTVRVRVVNAVTLQAMPDTTICATDTLQLYAITDGLRFLWDNPSTLNNPTLLRPRALPTATTTYTITATIGSCTATDNVTVRLVPYPIANAGADTTICFATPAQLNGSIVGSSFIWSPTIFLTNANTLSPTARPRTDTRYVLSVYDNLGCPKPGRDTVLVDVTPEVIAFAGRDTAVVVGQTLQLTATGGDNYSWSPPTALSSTTIPNPRAVYDGSFDSIRYVVRVQDNLGCTDEATILVKIFKTAPQIFVPTGFTPNGDGKNDVIRPIAVGIDRITYFRIYNRWGQMVFETTVNGKGWDGRIAGTPQATGVYVWLVRGSDYTGKAVEAKGTVTLIR